MKQSGHTASFVAVGAVLVLTTACSFGQNEQLVKEIGRTTEKELNVVLSTSFGTLIISRGEHEKMVVIESANSKKDDPPTSVEYSIRNRVGYLDITLGEVSSEGESKKKSFKLSNFDRGKWYLKFSDAVPISFDVQLGIGRGDFNLSGLNVKDFNLSAGASDVTLAFDEENKGSIDNLNIETGVSKFDGRSLGNANFKHFRFQGGLGAYTLDFSGNLKSEVDVDVEVGLGVLTIFVPSQLGAKIFYEKSWVSRLDVDRDFRSSAENEYASENFGNAAGRMNIRIDSGLGSIKVRRR